MPDPNYRSNRPEYYNAPKPRFATLSALIGGTIDSVNEEETERAFISEENYRAYATSWLPQKASDKAVIDRVIEIDSVLKVDPEQQASRRQMSEKARTAIVTAAGKCAPILKERTINNPLDALLYARGTSVGVFQENNRVAGKLKGTAKERGDLLEERINDIYDLYQQVLSYDFTDDELIEKFEQFQYLQDMVTNAGNFLEASYSQPQLGKKAYLSISPEVSEKLKDMERNALEVSRVIERVRLIANPNYEFLDLDRMLDMKEEQFQKINTYAKGDAKDKVIADAAEFVDSTRKLMRSAGKHNLMRRIQDDFPADFQNVRLDFIDKDGKASGMKYTTDPSDVTIQDHIRHGGVLVTAPSGKAICYDLDNSNGRVRESDSSQVFSQVAASAAGVFTELKKANKGFFIGSKEFRAALNDMPEILKSIREIEDPPTGEQLEQATAKLRKTLATAEKYLAKKEQGRSYEEMTAKMSPREKIRYDAMRHLADYCQMQIHVYALKKQELEAEMLANPDPGEPEMDVRHSIEENDHSALSVFPKVEEKYGEKAALEASDAGTIADELRADIYNSLSNVLTEDGFNLEEAKETFSNMVLLEVIKHGRSDNGLGYPAAGDLEKELANKAEPVVQAMRDDPRIQAASENLDLESFRQFVVNDGAKALADHILGVAKEYNPENQGNEPQNQLDQEKHPVVSNV